MPKSKSQIYKEKKKRGKIFKWSAWGLTYWIASAIFWPLGIFKWFIIFPVGATLGKIAQAFGEGLDTSKNLSKSNKQLIEEEVARQKAEEEAKKQAEEQRLKAEQEAKQAEEKLKKEKMQQGRTGIKEVDDLLDVGWETLNNIHEQNLLIPDEEFTSIIDELEAKIIRILKEVERDPSDAPKVRKFMNYYLPTTLKMLIKYAELEKAKVKGENIDYAKQKIEDAVKVVSSACDKQLEMLYQEEILDVTTDIQAMEQMLKRDGFVESEWDQIQKQNNTEGAH